MSLRDDIRRAIDQFLDLIEGDEIPLPTRVQRLRRALDQIALLQHDIRYDFDSGDYPDPPSKQYNAVRQRVSERFPGFGYYNVPAFITQKMAESDLEVGDAIDDITDIAIELYEVLWRWEHTSIDNALWYFVLSYSSHWEEHLRELQLYLHHLSREQEDASVD